MYVFMYVCMLSAWNEGLTAAILKKRIALRLPPADLGPGAVLSQRMC